MNLAELRSIAQKIRSKNAGPFWLTIDIFCGSEEVFVDVCQRLNNAEVAALFQINSQTIKRFEIAELNVIKLSLPRPETQGSLHDRDMHGASWAALLGELDV